MPPSTRNRAPMTSWPSACVEDTHVSSTRSLAGDITGPSTAADLGLVAPCVGVSSRDVELLGAASGGVWTRQQALEVVSAAQVATELRRGHWQQPWPGVYTDGGTEQDAGQRAFAAVLASGGAGQPRPIPGTPGRGRLRAVACGRTAARVHGLVLVDDCDPSTGAHEQDLDEVLVWSPRRPLSHAQPDGTTRVLRRRQLRPGPGDLVLLPSGLWVTSLLRTVVDCAGLLGHQALVCLLDDALHRRLLTPDALAAAVAARAWCAGAVALRAAVVAADGRAESPAETLLRLLLLPVLPGLVPQLRVRDGSGRVVARLDLGDAALRLGAEADGRRGHAGGRMVAKDQRRDRTTDGLGWRTERFTWFELRCRQHEVMARADTAARAQAARHRRP